MGRCKTYTGHNFKEAWLQVKMDLGEDAKIADSREVKNGFLGLFGESLVEIDAWLPEKEKSTNNHKKLSRNSRTRSSETSSFSKEWVVDGDDQPEFSPRDHAARLIDQKSGNNGRGGNSQTYSRKLTSNPPRKLKMTNFKRTPETDRQSSKELSGLIEKTDLLQEKIDLLVEKFATVEDVDAQQAPQYPGCLADLYARLVDQGVKKRYARRAMGQLRRLLEPHEIDQEEIVQEHLVELIGEKFTPARSVQPSDLPVILPFIGPTGVGKTTTLAKLAAQKLNENKSVGFISLDFYRLAAVDQLRCYADILDVPMLDIENYNAFTGAVDQLLNQGVEMIFVDTAGHSQFDEEKIDSLQGLFKVDLPRINHLVISATSRQQEVDSVLESFDRVGYDRLVITKLDETRSFGLLFNLLHRTDKPISHFTDGQDVPMDLIIAEADIVGNLLLRGEV